MKEIPEIKAGERLSASKLNILVEELRRLQNIKGGRRIEVSYTAAGVLIDFIDRILTIDDKYKLDEKDNQSDLIKRLCDHKLGDLADFLRIRNCIGKSKRDEEELLYRAMLMLDRTYDGGERGGEGGWITDAGLDGLALTDDNPAHAVPTPRSIGQLGDVLLLDSGDLLDTTPHDKDDVCYVNIRQDAHFYMSHARDGRIYFTQNAPGSESVGFPVMGEMVLDPAKANDALSQLGLESGEWRPQIKIPGIEYFDSNLVIYPNPDTGTYAYPAGVYPTDVDHMMWEYPDTGLTGFSAHCQLPYKVPSYGLGLRIKFSAINEGGSPVEAYFTCDWKLTNDNEDMSAAPDTTGFFLSVPAGNTEKVLQYQDVPIVPYSYLADRDTWLLDVIARDPSNPKDLLEDRLLILSMRPILMSVPEPPL